MAVQLVPETDSPGKTILRFKGRLYAKPLLQGLGAFVLVLACTFVLKNLFGSGENPSSLEKLLIFMITGTTVALAIAILLFSASLSQGTITALCRRYGYGVDNFLNSAHGANAGNLQSNHLKALQSKSECRVMLPQSQNVPKNVAVYLVRDQNGLHLEEIAQQSS